MPTTVEAPMEWEYRIDCVQAEVVFRLDTPYTIVPSYLPGFGWEFVSMSAATTGWDDGVARGAVFVMFRRKRSIMGNLTRYEEPLDARDTQRLTDSEQTRKFGR